MNDEVKIKIWPRTFRALVDAVLAAEETIDGFNITLSRAHAFNLHIPLCEDVRAGLDEWRKHPPESATPAAAAFVSAALEVVSYAVAQLDPIANRGWPWRALAQLGELVTDPGVPLAPIRREIASALREHAALARRWEEARAQGRERELLQAENLASHTSADPEK